MGPILLGPYYMANMAFHTYQTTSSINNLGSSHDPTSSQQQAAFEQSAAAAQQAAQAAFLQQQAQNQQSQPQMNQVPIPPHKVEFNVRHNLYDIIYTV